jgi:hypothetical protein
MESYIDTYSERAPDYAAIQMTILNSSDRMGFLTVLAGNQVVLVHSLGLFSSGIGRSTPAHNRILGLLGEKVGTDLPPIVMVPTAGLTPWWIKVQRRYQPKDNNLDLLENRTDMMILRPAVEEDEDEMSVQNICFVIKAWAPYFLAPMSPWDALKVFRRLLETIPAALQTISDFLGSWLAIACTHDRTNGGGILTEGQMAKSPLRTPHDSMDATLNAVSQCRPGYRIWGRTRANIGSPRMLQQGPQDGSIALATMGGNGYETLHPSQTGAPKSK